MMIIKNVKEYQTNAERMNTLKMIEHWTNNGKAGKYICVDAPLENAQEIGKVISKGKIFATDCLCYENDDSRVQIAISTANCLDTFWVEIIETYNLLEAMEVMYREHRIMQSINNGVLYRCISGLLYRNQMNQWIPCFMDLMLKDSIFKKYNGSVPC